MVLINNQILAAFQSGEIVCVPPDAMAKVNNASVDVHLGAWVARTARRNSRWHLNEANAEDEFVVTNLDKDLYMKGVLELLPGERVLAHTHEFIGTRSRLLPEMRAKSTFARWGLTVCACAGWGDVGFHNRWAMEIKNLNAHETIKVEVGTAIAQIVFHETETVPEDQRYGVIGNYQKGDDLEAMVRDWKPQSILPKKLKRASLTALACDAGD